MSLLSLIIWVFKDLFQKDLLDGAWLPLIQKAKCLMRQSECLNVSVEWKEFVAALVVLYGLYLLQAVHDL